MVPALELSRSLHLTNMRKNIYLFGLWISLVSFGWCQADRAVMVREAILYLSPDTNSSKIGRATRGREVAVLEQSKYFVKVLVSTGEGAGVTGWILNKGIVRTSTPNGDAILFGEGVDSEAEASRSRGRKGAAVDAMRLYYHMAEYFPKSPFAGEALWRAADIRWQVEKDENSLRPSSHERDPYLRNQIDEDYVHEVEKKFPGTKWSDLAAFDKIDNKLCGDWQGLPKCPEKESELYEKYVKEHSNSPKAAEATYEAARRQAALVEIYKGMNDDAKSGAARTHAIQLCQQIISQYSQVEDWPTRAQRLLFLMEQSVTIYGTTIE